MIISHHDKFIFLKTPKTGGTSMEIALSRFCGEEDIIAPISPQDEQLRKTLGYRVKQNYRIPFSKYSPQDWVIFFLRRKRLKFQTHIGAKDVQRLIGEKMWNEYYKFCFFRNPWDRVVSLYYWRYKHEPRPPISAFIDSYAANGLYKNVGAIYMIDNKIAVDRVFLYESLAEELEEISQRLGLPETLSLPRAKGGFRREKKPYREILSPEDKEKIERMFSQEIFLFGYQY